MGSKIYKSKETLKQIVKYYRSLLTHGYEKCTNFNIYNTHLKYILLQKKCMHPNENKLQKQNFTHM